jgi:hypothetical protein
MTFLACFQQVFRGSGYSVGGARGDGYDAGPSHPPFKGDAHAGRGGLCVKDA